MTTFRQAIYMVLDLLKMISDDAYYTEEHILFILSKARAALLEKEYEESRNQAFNDIDKSNYQTLEYHLEPYDKPYGGRGELYIGVDGEGNTKIVPKIVPQTPVYAFEDKNLTNEYISFVPPERLPFVGYNKWLRKFIYCSVSNDDELFVKQLTDYSDPVDIVYLYAQFEDAAGAAEMSADPNDESVPDVLDRRFPLEDNLIMPCIEYAIQLLTGYKFTPEDRYNNGKDDFSDMSVSAKQTSKSDS